MDNYKIKKALKIVVPIFVILTIILIIIMSLRSLPPKELISTETYDIYEMTIDENKDYIYYSYVDSDNKVTKCCSSNSEIFDIVYLSDKNQVTIEKWGRGGKVSTVKLKKFHMTEETYQKFSEEFEWSEQYEEFF